ncbi:MAG: MBL fold metallo-hydrolase [Candidatus Hermodarchaeota archaeon]
METDFDLERISERTVAITEKLFANAGGIALNNFIVTIDPTMFPATARLLRAKMERQFNLPVKYLYITHYHGDHVYGLGPFKDTIIFGSTVLIQNMIKAKKTEWTPEDFEKWKNMEPEKADWIDEIEIIIPAIGFQNKLEIHDEDLVVEFYQSGGHTSCSGYAYFPDEKVLFAGDLMFAKGFPYAGDPTCDPEQWIQVFKDFLALDFEKLIPGHGPVVGQEEVENHLTFFEALKEATKEAIKLGETYEAIIVPEFYKLEENNAWIETANLKLWYNFYKEKRI